MHGYIKDLYSFQYYINFIIAWFAYFPTLWKHVFIYRNGRKSWTIWYVCPQVMDLISNVLCFSHTLYKLSIFIQIKYFYENFNFHSISKSMAQIHKGRLNWSHGLNLVHGLKNHNFVWFFTYTEVQMNNECTYIMIHVGERYAYSH